jgi:hypothetical protein
MQRGPEQAQALWAAHLTLSSREWYQGMLSVAPSCYTESATSTELTVYLALTPQGIYS